MAQRRVGLWLVGAFGGVGTTITLGLAALARGLAGTSGLVTELPLFEGLGLAAPADFVVGGHEIRESSFLDSAEEFRRGSGVFDLQLIDACRDELAATSRRVRAGTTLGAGPAISALGAWGHDADSAPLAAVDRLASDMRTFASVERVDHLIVLNVASTEPPFPAGQVPRDWATLRTALAARGETPVPASTLYAIAALREGFTYLNFTPSLGASLPALYQLAEATGALHGGKDGKTGETLLKTVLAPMFALRNLRVLSWVGHNIFGNRDAVILNDPANKASKVDTKDRVVSSILGYRPDTLVSIESIPDMGDWKTAWDHIHFQGFLGTKMTLQFTWQGCDSLLAAPLAIDLARLADLEKQHAQRGLMRHLAPFFKGPEGVDDNDFFRQSALLAEHVQKYRR
jgi:myo-inositol-1-phosphate synthase